MVLYVVLVNLVIVVIVSLFVLLVVVQDGIFIQGETY